MRVTIATVGSRGDVQPFLALALALSRAGHSVRVATNAPFRGLVEAYGVGFTPIAGDIKEIVGDRGRAALLDAGANPLRAMRALREHVGPLVRQGLDALPRALEGSDAVIGQILAPGAVHWAEASGVPYFDASYDPLFPTREFPHCGGPVGVPRGLASWVTYVAAEQVFWQAFRRDVDRFRRSLGLSGARFLGPSLPARRRPPALLGYSSLLAPRAADWPEHVTVTGPWLLDAPPDFRPPQPLLDFLADGPAPVFVGFGSMTVENPGEMSRLVVSALRRAGQRAVISTGWGALGEARGDDVFTVADLPHAWLFPRMSAVVHHGGSSTSAEALRAGVPQFVVPFLSDQPFWGHHVARVGVGPKPIPIRQLTAERLHAALVALADPAMRTHAAAIGQQARKERGADVAAEAVTRGASIAVASAA